MDVSVFGRIAEARAALVRAGLPSADAALDAEVLARDLLGWDRARLLTHGDELASDEFAAAFRQAVARRAAREPVAYITGRREFWGLDFDVTPDVLIPRPETELLVEAALRESPRFERPSIVDVGTGSGCIAVALATELPHARIVAVDLSAAALHVAARNAARHGVHPRIGFVRANLLDAIRGPVDLIVSNPPYVSRGEAPSLQPEVARYEPASALFADDDGMAVLQRLFETAAPLLTRGGRLIVEFGFGQSDRLQLAARAAGWIITTIDDLAGIPRAAILSPAER